MLERKSSRERKRELERKSSRERKRDRRERPKQREKRGEREDKKERETNQREEKGSSPSFAHAQRAGGPRTCKGRPPQRGERNHGRGFVGVRSKKRWR